MSLQHEKREKKAGVLPCLPGMWLVAAHAAGAALPVFGVFAGGGLIFMAFGNAGC